MRWKLKHFLKLSNAFKLILTSCIICTSLVVFSQPTVTIGLPSPTLTNTGPVTYTVTYVGATTINLTAGDVILINTGTASGSVSVADGTTSTPEVTINSIVGDGTLTISIIAGTSNDGSDDDTGAGAATPFDVDNTAPDVPAAPDLADGSDTGSSNSDDLTRDRTPTFDGTHAEDDVNIKLYDGATLVGNGDVSSGSFSITSSILSNGEHNDLKFTATDDAGNVSANSPSFSMFIDRTNPTVVLNDNHPDDIVRNANNVTITAVFTEAKGLDGTPKISIGSDVSSANMSMSSALVWTYNWNVPSGNNGPAAVIISVDDDAGNANNAATSGTGPTTYTIDNIDPSFVSVNDAGDNNYRPGETITFDVDLGEPGLTVTVDLSVINSGFSSSQALSDDGDGTYSFTTPDVNTGGNMIEGTSIAVTFSATDVAGNGPVTDNSLTLLLDKTRPSFSSGLVANSAKNQLVASFNSSIFLSDATGFSVSGTSAGPIIGVSGSGTSTITFTLTGNVSSTDIIDLSYDGSNNATDVAGNNLNSFTNSPITNDVEPGLNQAEVFDANPNLLVATFDEPITLADATGFSVSGTAGNILPGVTGSGSTVITFTLDDDVRDTDNVLVHYDGSNGSTTLPAFSNFIVTNLVLPYLEPQDHVSSFTVVAASTTSINLSWTESGNPQLPENYLIVGRDAISGSFASVADGNPVANDSNWGNGNFAINVPVGTTNQSITGLISGRNYIFRIYPYTNILASIDFKTSATVPQDNATLSVGAETIITNGSGVSTMSSTIDTKGEALAASGNFTFTIDDDGSSNSIDTAPTLIDGIIIHRDVGTDETGDWTNAIAGVVLKDNGTGTLNSADNPGSFSITADAITITNIPNSSSSDLGHVADNGTKDYSLVVWLRTDLVSTGLEIDKKNLVFSVADTDFTVETVTEPLSSTFATSNASSGISRNEIVVTASELYWKSVTGISTAHTNFTVVVQATDENKNRDYDRTGNVVMVATTKPTGGYLESEDPNDTDEPLVNGQFTRTDMQVHLPGTYEFSAALSGLANGSTGPHVFVDGDALSDITITSFNPVDNIDYHLFQESPVNGDGSGDIKVAEFEVRDGGTTTDGDGAATVLTDITFSLSNFGNVRQVGIFDGTNIIESKAATASVTFADLTTISAADNGTAIFSLYVSFESAVTDNENFQFQITNAVGSGSTFAMNNAGGASSPLTGDDNRIEVTATQLDFHSTPLNSIQGLFTPIAPAQPQVFANDTNGNLDVDFNSPAVVTSSANIINIPTAFSNVSPGVLDFPSFQYSGAGDGTISVLANGINGSSNSIDVIHTTFTNLDLGAANTNDNNGIEAQIDLLATAVDKAILGFSLSAVQDTPNEPTLVDITITFGNQIGSSLTNLRLLSSTDSKYTVPETNVSNTTNVGADFVSFESINIPLNGSNLYYFVVADIAATANFISPPIFPRLEVSGVNLSSGSLTANIIGRTYTFKDTSPPEITSLVPANGNDNFPQNGIISMSFNEAVDPIDNIIHVYSLATDTLVSTLIIESISGDEQTFFFNPELPLVGSPLDGDIDYYILIPIGDGITKGFKDKSGNPFGGITSSSGWVFKTSDTVAPFFTADLPSPTLPAQAVNIIDKGFDLRIALDEPGKIFYIVVDQDVTTGSPTVDEIRNASFSGTINSGTADILRGIQYQYVSIFDDVNFPTPSTGGRNFRVWITAEDLANPVPNKMVDGDPFHPGIKAVDGVFTSSPGTGLFIQNTPGNVPADICLGEYQLIFEPINIVEGSDNGFVSGLGQTINFILPPDFEFKTDIVNVIGQGGDISNVSFNFINSTILTITYDIDGTNDRDKLIISGLEVKALGNIGTSGNITRLGGTGALSIADGDPLISFNTTQITPVEFITVPNTFSIGDENVIIPLETPSLNALDKGTRLFSGPGVFGDTLYIAAAGLGTHTITFNYTDEIGCTSEFSLDRNIFDSDNAIVGLNSTYCTNDDPVTILFNARQNFSLDSLMIRVSDVQPTGIDTVDVFKVDSQGGVIISLDTVTGTSNYEFFPSRFINVENFDKFTNTVDATNDGGLIGELTFTGIYQSLLDVTQVDILEKRVKIYYSPTSEIIIDGFNPIGDTLFDKGNIPPILTAISSLPGELEFCEDEGNIPLKGSSSSGFFSISMRVPNPADSSLAPIIVTDSTGIQGLVDNGDGSGFLQPQILVDSTIFSFGELEIKFTVISPEGGCNSSVAQTIRIHPTPVTEFIVPPVICEDTPIDFADNTSYLSEDLDLIDDNPSINNTVVPQTTRWVWDFNDLNSVFNPATDTLSNPIHTYEDPGLYNVKLSSVSEFGCEADTTTQLIIGGLPTASFDMAGTSLNEEFEFISSSDVLRSIGPFDHAIDSVAWDIDGDGLFDIGSNDADPMQNNADTLYYSYADSLSFGTYNLNFMAISTTGCSTTISPTIQVLSNIQADSTAANSYKETFSVDDGNWVALPEISTSGDASSISWAWGAPNKPTIIPSMEQGTNVWVTGLTTQYDSAEQSYVYSPAFDLRNLARPMIQLDVFKDLEEQDGVIFEYSTDSFNIMDSRKVWKALGIVDEGIEWFDAIGLAGSPGNDATGLGWTGSDASWVTAKHSLGDVYKGIFTPEKIDSIKSRVLFRIGLGAIASATSVKTRDGFAFDNVFVGNRTRTVLLENFTSMAQGANTKFENEAINTLSNSADGTELIVLTYHNSFDGEDLLNLNNPSEPAARALYYGVSTTPRVAIDGKTGPEGNIDNSNLLFSEWGESFYSKRTLQIAPFEISLELDRDNINDGKVRIFADITAKEDIDTSFVVHIAVVEKEILPEQIGISGLPESGESIFYNTLRKLLPNAAGTRFIGSKVQGSLISVTETWDPTNVVDPDDTAKLQVIVFIQNEVSNEVLQAASINFTKDIVLALEEDLTNRGIALYPNPADRQITIKLANKPSKEARAMIIDNTGKQIEEVYLHAGQDTIELNTLEYLPGIYMFTLPTKTGSVMKRFVISHR